MATDAGFGNPLILTSQMTAPTTQSLVSSIEGECGLCMVKMRADPTIDVVAIVAGTGELPLMVVIFLVAADAGRGCLAISLAGLMAALAPERAVCASQRKIGALMIELGDIQSHDIGVSSQVLRVAADAPARSCIGHTPVIALVVSEVGSDWLVAVEAQRALPRPISPIMAIAAGGL